MKIQYFKDGKRVDLTLRSTILSDDKLPTVTITAKGNPNYIYYKNLLLSKGYSEEKAMSLARQYATQKDRYDKVNSERNSRKRPLPLQNFKEDWHGTMEGLAQETDGPIRLGFDYSLGGLLGSFNRLLTGQITPLPQSSLTYPIALSTLSLGDRTYQMARANESLLEARLAEDARLAAEARFRALHPASGAVLSVSLLYPVERFSLVGLVTDALPRVIAGDYKGAAETVFGTAGGHVLGKGLSAGAKYLRNGYNNGELFGYQRYFETTGKVDANGVELTRPVWIRPPEGTPYTRSSSGQVTTQFTKYSAPRLPQQGVKLETPKLNFAVSPRVRTDSDLQRLITSFDNKTKDIFRLTTNPPQFTKPLPFNLGFAASNGTLIDPKAKAYYHDVVAPKLYESGQLNRSSWEGQQFLDKVGTAELANITLPGHEGVYIPRLDLAVVDVAARDPHSVIIHEGVSHRTDEMVELLRSMNPLKYNYLSWLPPQLNNLFNTPYGNVLFFWDTNGQFILKDMNTGLMIKSRPGTAKSFTQAEMRSTMNELRAQMYDNKLTSNPTNTHTDVTFNGTSYSLGDILTAANDRNGYGATLYNYVKYLGSIANNQIDFKFATENFLGSVSPGIQYAANYLLNLFKSNYKNIYGLPVVGGVIAGATQKDKQGGKIKYFK